MALPLLCVVLAFVSRLRNVIHSAQCMHACMESFQAAILELVVNEIHIFVTTAGNFKIITLEHMQKMRSNAIVANIGHLDYEIQLADLEEFPGIKVETSSRKLIILFSHLVMRLLSSPLAASSTSALPLATRLS